jgi:hypothetical protein
MCTEREMSSKELSGMWGLASPKSAGWVGRQLKFQSVQSLLLVVFLLALRRMVFVLSRALTDWMRPTGLWRPMCSKSSHVSVNFIHKVIVDWAL